MAKEIFINDGADVFKHTKIFEPKQESFMVLILNNRNKLVKQHMVSLGTANNCQIHPRDVFREAIKENAVGIVLAHNHPSGDSTPSEEDKEITKVIASAGKLLGIDVLDHVVIGNDKYFSFVDRGIMPQVILRKKYEGDNEDE
jgi:DNA repair protein RadC